MSRKVNWKNIEKSVKSQQRKIKNLQAAGDYLKNRPEKGYFIDNISKNPVKIIDAKSSSLRRYLKVIDNYYYLITSREDKNYLLEKKVEIETELNHRDDAIKEEE
jgi:hypothetical protein